MKKNWINKQGIPTTGIRIVATVLSAVGALVAAVGPAKAQTIAPGPYYPNPSWDQTLACTALANCPRFSVLSNMGSTAVLDRETGLVWEKSPTAPPSTWVVAQYYCINLNVGGRTGWRLPTIHELLSLVDRSVSPPGPALPTGHPFTNVKSAAQDDYWSATTLADASGAVWGVRFSNGLVPYGDKARGGLFVWCVRGGAGVDAQ